MRAAPATPPVAALAQVWDGLGGDPGLVDLVHVIGDDPVLPSVFRVGTAAAAAVGAATLAVAALHHDRGGPPPSAQVDLVHAATAFRSEALLRVDGASPGSLWAPLSRDVRTADGFIRLHGGYPHHAAAIRRVLGLPRGPADDDATDHSADVAALKGAAARWTAVDLEEAVVTAGGAAAAMRTRAEWLDRVPGRAVAALPLVETTPLGPTLPRPLGPAARPLAGVRVLDLTHVVAGPVCGRVLAAHGADVVHVGAAHLPVFTRLWSDTAAGKRSCHLDLRATADRAAFEALVADTDVVVQSYRPGALAGLGYGPEALAVLRPGLVIVSISAFGRAGPWSDRRGFDSLVQSATGIAHEQMVVARTDHPLPLPCQALDHATGWLAAAGAVAALRRRGAVGGGARVALSLARTAAWLDGLGRVEGGLDTSPPPPEAVAPFLEEVDSCFGRLTRVRPPGTTAGPPPCWDRPPPPIGGDAPTW